MYNQRREHDRIHEAIVAGAVGDALGWPTEFMRRHEIDEYGWNGGVRAFVSPDGGVITDDTQMLLFTAEAMVRARTYQRSTGSYGAILSCAFSSYIRWAQTQSIRRTDVATDQRWTHLADTEPSFLLGDERLHIRRAPGNTCMASLVDDRAPGTRTNRLNASKGCGTVMRIAPVGMVFHDVDPADVFAIGVEVSAITHSHPTGYMAGGAMAVITQVLVTGGTLEDAVNTALNCLNMELVDEAKETINAIDLGMRKGCSSRLDVSMLDSLGGGWIAEEALGIAIAATAACGGNTMDALATCAAIDGDSDSVASVTGTLCGALYGINDEVRALFKSIREHDLVQRVAEMVIAS